MAIELPPPLTRSDLDEMVCSAHPDEPLVLQGACHPGGGMNVSYLNGAITIECHRCKKLVARVSVMACTMLETQAVQSLAMWAEAHEPQDMLVPTHVRETLDHAREHGLLPPKGYATGTIVPQGPVQ